MQFKKFNRLHQFVRVQEIRKNSWNLIEFNEFNTF